MGLGIRPSNSANKQLLTCRIYIAKILMWRCFLVGIMKIRMRIALTALFASCGLVSLTSAEAAPYYAKFYTGTTGYGTAGEPFSGSSANPTVYYKTENSTTDVSPCPTHGSCTNAGGDNVRTSLTFNIPSGPTITATAGGVTNIANGPIANKVWGDFAPNFGGLGVGIGSPSDADQIAGTDVLILNFSSQIQLTGVGTLFDANHTTFGTSWPNPSSINGSQQFYLSADGGATWNLETFGAANLMQLSLAGTTFEFKEYTNSSTGAELGPEFYVSALSFNVCGGNIVCSRQGTTSLPATLPLFASGLGALGLLGWRKKRKAQAAA